jgi:deoxyhypusine synthase
MTSSISRSGIPGSVAPAISGDESTATAAVLKPSAPVPADSKQVDGIDFNKYADRDITVAEMVAGMTGMGFQATAVGQAVRIINDMV